MTPRTLPRWGPGQARTRAVIHAIVEARGLTTTELGAVLDCTPSAAAMKLRGERGFSIDDLLRAAEAFKIDPGQILKPNRRILTAIDEADAVAAAVNEATGAVRDAARQAADSRARLADALGVSGGSEFAWDRIAGSRRHLSLAA